MIAHAKLGASSADRWMNCPGSVQLSEGMPDSKSEHAALGTKAHDLAELCLKHKLDAIELPDNDEWAQYPHDMRHYVQQYLDYVRARLFETGGRLLVEQRVDYSDWVPGGFGTSDAIILADDRIICVDLKYGTGVKVYAERNRQAMLYALGAYSGYWYDLPDAPKVESVIVQPRLDHIDEAEQTLEELLAFADEARKAAELALSDNPPLVPGDKQCRFCRAKAVCRARADRNLSIAVEEFGEPVPVPDKLDLDEIGELLPKLDDIAQWVKDVKEYALQQAVNGGKIKGHKVVAGRSVRRWAPDAAERLAEHDDLFERKLLGIGQAEKVLGKGSDLIKELTVKPEGKPALVPASDKRPEIQGQQSAADDFA